MPVSIGIFLVALSLTLSGCNKTKFASSTAEPAPQTPAPSTPTPQSTRDVTYNGAIKTPNNKLDILLVIDDSNSMLPENQKLASRMAGFLNTLQNWSIDWQMCITVTRSLNINNRQVWGPSIMWNSYTPPTGTAGWILKSNNNLSTIFTNTINNIGAGWAGTDDERGIKAAYWHLYNGDVRYSNNSKCYRTDAALAMILISDEDVRSVGGDKSQEYYSGEHRPLENDDLPSALINQVRDIFGNNKRFTFNSIIVKPGDSTCLQAQDAGGAKSHYGHKYAELSSLTGGGVGSICANDYSTNLNIFADNIQDSIASIPLECNPVGPVQVSVTPAVSGLKTEVKGSSLVFTPNVPAGRNLSLKYKCAVK